MRVRKRNLKQWLKADLPVAFPLVREAAESFRITWDSDPATLKKLRQLSPSTRTQWLGTRT